MIQDLWESGPLFPRVEPFVVLHFARLELGGDGLPEAVVVVIARDAEPGHRVGQFLRAGGGAAEAGEVVEPRFAELDR